MHMKGNTAGYHGHLSITEVESRPKEKTIAIGITRGRARCIACGGLKIQFHEGFHVEENKHTSRTAKYRVGIFCWGGGIRRQEIKKDIVFKSPRVEGTTAGCHGLLLGHVFVSKPHKNKMRLDTLSSYCRISSTLSCGGFGVPKWMTSNARRQQFRNHVAEQPKRLERTKSGLVCVEILNRRPACLGEEGTGKLDKKLAGV